jgi:hypothetical protein
MGNKDLQVIKIALTYDELANRRLGIDWRYGWGGAHSNNTTAEQAALQYLGGCASSCLPFWRCMRKSEIGEQSKVA